MELRPHQVEALDAMCLHNEGIINLPTGCGKTVIEALSIVQNIDNAYSWLNTINTPNPNNVPVFVILAPRIILCNQLYHAIQSRLHENDKDCQYLIVHSGRVEDRRDMRWRADLPFREIRSTTSSTVILEEYERAVRENVPLIIFATYDSSERIVNPLIPVYMLHCDEAQYLVSEGFSWIAREHEAPSEKQFHAHRKYYFTATMKETKSNNGLGMNNRLLFGPVIYQKTPLDMIKAAEIIRPRMHFIDTARIQGKVSEIDYDVHAIIQGFTEHRTLCNTSAKLLVITKGSDHLNDIVIHPKMTELLNKRPNLKIFDISSMYHPRINGQVVRRERFLRELQSMGDADEALIFHINILSEGIDVPGITGILPMNTLQLGKFLQTLGRATRLHTIDRAKLYEGSMGYNELEKFIKDYAWIIIPVYGILGEDLRAQIADTVYALRSFGFNSTEDVVIQQVRGTSIPQTLDSLNTFDERATSYYKMMIHVTHEIEEREEADRLEIESYREAEHVVDQSIDEIIKDFEALNKEAEQVIEQPIDEIIKDFETLS